MQKIVNMAQVMTCLDQLEKFPMSRSLLESTRIGRVVNDLRKFTDERTTRRIKGLIRAWHPLLNHLDPTYTLVPSLHQNLVNGSAVSTASPSSSIKKSLSQNCLRNEFCSNSTTVTASIARKQGSHATLSEVAPSSPALSIMSQSSAQSFNSKAASFSIGEPESGSIQGTALSSSRLKRTADEKSINSSLEYTCKRPRLESQLTEIESQSPCSVAPQHGMTGGIGSDVFPEATADSPPTSTAVTTGATEAPIKLVIRFGGQQNTPPSICNNNHGTRAASSSPSPPLLMPDSTSSNHEPSGERSRSRESSCERSTESGHFLINPATKVQLPRMHNVNVVLPTLNGELHSICTTSRVKNESKVGEEFRRLARQQDLADSRSLHSGSSAHTGTTRSRGGIASRIPKVKSTAEILSGLDSPGIGRDTYNQILNNELVKEPDLPPVVPSLAQARRARRVRKDAGTALNPLEATPDLVKQSKRDILNKFLNSAAACGERVLAPGEGEELQVASNLEPAYAPTAATEHLGAEQMSTEDSAVHIKGKSTVGKVDRQPNLLHMWPKLTPLPEQVDWGSLDYSLPHPNNDSRSEEHDRQSGVVLGDGRSVRWTDGFVVETRDHAVDVWPWINFQVWPCQPSCFPDDALQRLEDAPEKVW